MTTGHVFIATSLDGFVARKNHSLDWLMKQQTEGEEHGNEAFMASVDGIVMGRGSFLTVLKFEPWPYQKPVVVMSQSLSIEDIPDDLRSKVELTQLSPKALMASLNERGWRRAYIDGGLVVQSFLREDLIEDMVVTLIPILLGSGIRLFGTLPNDVNLKLESYKSFPSGLLGTRYRIMR